MGEKERTAQIWCWKYLPQVGLGSGDGIIVIKEKVGSIGPMISNTVLCT